MKTQLIALLITLPLLTTAADVSLLWNASPAAEQVTGYHVYERINGVSTPAGVTTTNTFTLTSVAQGVHTYVVTATNIWGESAPSNPASTPGSASAPVNVRITITVTVP